MASLERIIRNLSHWLTGEGPASDIVLSSRVRLARNLRDTPFPHRMTAEQSRHLLQRVKGWLEGRGDTADPQLSLLVLDGVEELERMTLVEKHLISPLLAHKEGLAGVALSQDERLSMMVNEEDHFRVQALLPGLQLEPAWKLADDLDNAVEEAFDIAFSNDVGYLTTCPTNVGTGMRASVMVHLPALVMSGRMARVVEAMAKVGLVVRGLYGEGTQAAGNIFQVSNQITLGRSEKELLANLEDVTRQLLQQERAARERLLREKKLALEDRIGRAYGILTHARRLTSAEAIQLLSDMRLGIDLNLISHLRPKVFNELLVLTRPAYLQKWTGEELSGEARDVRRAALVRERLSAAARRQSP